MFACCSIDSKYCSYKDRKYNDELQTYESKCFKTQDDFNDKMYHFSESKYDTQQIKLLYGGRLWQG